MGFGKSARSVLEHLVGDFETVGVFDDGLSFEELQATLQREGVGGVALDIQGAREFVLEVDLVVPSPGVSPRHPLVALATEHAIRVAGDIQLAFDLLLPSTRLVAVTGTNGKTTVTEMVGHICAEAGLSAAVCGNIGLPILEALATPADVLVCEVSSFQLFYTDSFAPQIGIWLNFEADHLDWHLDLDEYVAAKSNIWSRQQAGQIAIFNAADEVVVREVTRYEARKVGFALDSNANWHVSTVPEVEGDCIVGPAGVLCPVSEVSRGYPHDLLNAMASAAACSELGLSYPQIAAGLATYNPGAHRLELIASFGGMDFVDDSKATNPHAAAAAIRCFESSVLIAGGFNKGLKFAPLAGEVSRLRAVIGLGQAGPEMASTFEGLVPTRVASDMQEAVEAAFELAKSGDVVLLSPACASFDAYRSYAERGDDFARRVLDYIEHLDSEQGARQ